MLRTTSALPGSVMKWMSQVTASVGATLIATMIYSALPRSAPSETAPRQPELTSGGKFAARAILPAATEAYDGLDAMPLPHRMPAAVPTALVAAPAAAAEPLAAAPVQVRHVAWDGAAPLLLAPPERPARLAKPSHPSARPEPRRAAVASAETQPRAAAVPPAPVETEASADEGLMPKVLSKARDAWILTASASGSLMARVVPQIP